MIRGSKTIVKSFKAYFDVIGSNIFYYGGEPGNSQVAKLVNKMILGINMNVLAVLLKYLKAAFIEELKHNVTLPFNALSSPQLFDSMGKEKPDD